METETKVETRYLIGVAPIFKTQIKLSPELAESIPVEAHRNNAEIVANMKDLLSQGLTTVTAYIRLDDVLGDDMFVEDIRFGRPGTRYYWTPEDGDILVECPRLLANGESFFMSAADLDLPSFTDDSQVIGYRQS